MASSDILQCQLCMDSTYELRLLACSHSYCNSCLERWLQARQNRGFNRIICPQCRQVTTLPEDGVKGLVRGISMRRAKELIDSTSNLSHGMKSNKCSFCSNEEINGLCKSCKKYLCKDCRHAHMQKSVFKNHEIRDYNSFVYCTSHPSEDLEYFCDICKDPLCVVCVMHHEHETIPFQQEIDRVESSFSTLIKDLKLKVKDLNDKKFQLEGNAVRKMLEKNKYVISDEIRKTFDETIQSLHSLETNMLKELDEGIDESMKEYDNIAALLNVSTLNGSALLKTLSDINGKELAIRNKELQDSVDEIEKNLQIISDYSMTHIFFERTQPNPYAEIGILKKCNVDLEYLCPLSPTKASTLKTKHAKHISAVYENIKIHENTISTNISSAKKTPPPVMPKPANK